VRRNTHTLNKHKKDEQKSSFPHPDRNGSAIRRVLHERRFAVQLDRVERTHTRNKRDRYHARSIFRVFEKENGFLFSFE